MRMHRRQSVARNDWPAALVAVARLLPSTAVVAILSCGAAWGACGSTGGVEYGDAVYRELKAGMWLQFINYNHAGLFAGLRQSDGLARTIEATGAFGDTTSDVCFHSGYTSKGDRYYGAYGSADGDLSFADRVRVMNNAILLEEASITYTIFGALDYYIAGGFSGHVSDIAALRCDGVVEYAYEKAGHRVWHNGAGPDSHWSIVSFPIYHFTTPSVLGFSYPSLELSPWSQRGAPSDCGAPLLVAIGPRDHSRLSAPSRVDVPTYSVTVMDQGASVRVTIRATDKSGIHRIGYLLPGSTAWSYSPRQAQHPTSSTFSYSVDVVESGHLHFFAEDNGGNKPAFCESVSVVVDDTDPEINILSPTASTGYATGDAVLDIGGDSSDDVGVTVVTWENSRGGSGMCSGTVSWNKTGIPLYEGGNTIGCTAHDAAGNTASDFLTVTYVPLPDKASGESPGDALSGIPIGTALSWASAANADGYEVYLKKGALPGPGDLRSEQAGTFYDPAALTYDSAYFWRVDTVNLGGRTVGDSWSFVTESEPVTPPAKAILPTPEDGATHQPYLIALRWADGGGAEVYDVYFGTDMTPDASDFAGRQSVRSHAVGPLESSTTYYWRIDASNPAGTTEGDVWMFTTSEPPPTPEHHPADTNEDWRITVSEIVGYASAWKAGISWNGEVADETNMLRGVFLWRWGEEYEDTLTDKPDGWIPSD